MPSEGSTARLHPVATRYRTFCIAAESATLSPAEVRQLRQTVATASNDFKRLGVEIAFLTLGRGDGDALAARCLKLTGETDPDRLRTMLISSRGGSVHILQERGVHRLESTDTASRSSREVLGLLLRSALRVLESPATF